VLSISSVGSVASIGSVASAGSGLSLMSAGAWRSVMAAGTAKSVMGRPAERLPALLVSASLLAVAVGVGTPGVRPRRELRG
jgi:hypothetical protein